MVVPQRMLLTYHRRKSLFVQPAEPVLCCVCCSTKTLPEQAWLRLGATSFQLLRELAKDTRIGDVRGHGLAIGIGLSRS